MLRKPGKFQKKSESCCITLTGKTDKGKINMYEVFTAQSRVFLERAVVYLEK